VIKISGRPRLENTTGRDLTPAAKLPIRCQETGFPGPAEAWREAKRTRRRPPELLISPAGGRNRADLPGRFARRMSIMEGLWAWSSQDFLPHGYCLQWRSGLVWLHVISDAAIALAYFSIPLTLGHFARRRRDFPFRWLLGAFAAFIFACASTHVFGIITLWFPIYESEGVVKALTAAISVATACGLVWVAPQVLSLRSPVELELLNRSLLNQIAERAKAEQALSRARCELEERVAARTAELAEKNVELEQIIYTVSHDLRSPLVTISGFAGLIDGHLESRDFESVRESVQRIQNATGRMATLIEDLLEISRIGRRTLHPEPVEVLSLLSDLAKELAPRFEQIGAALELQRDLPDVVADRSALSQVFENLLTNALKYGHNEDGTARVSVGGHQERGEVRFFVRDTGPGIERQYQQSIFALFQRLDTTKEGTGLGLAIVAKIMAQHGGRVWVDSEPGQGATFWIAFPKSAAVAKEMETV
jgi:signal transduction histidine kinase